MVERLDRVERRRGSPRAAPPRPPRRAACSGSKRSSNSRTSLAVSAAFVGQHVVLVALGEARADALAVLAVGAQDLDLAPVAARRATTSRLSESDSVSPRQTAEMQSATRSPWASQVERLVARAEHAEVLHPGLAVAARQARRDLLDHAQPEVLEHRHRRATARPCRRSCRAPTRVRSPRSSALVLQPDDERLAERLQPLEAADVVHGERRRGRRPCSSAGSARPSSAASTRPCAVAVARDERVAQLGRPTCGWRPRPRARARGSRRRAGPPAAWTGKWTCTRSPSPSTSWGSTALGREALAEQRPQRARAASPCSARAAARRSATRCAPSGSRRPSSRTCSPCSASSATTAPRRSSTERGEQLVLGERVEQRDRGLVVVRALDQVLGREDLAQLAVQQRRLARGLGVGLRGEQAEQPRLADDLAVGPRSGARRRSPSARAGARGESRLVLETISRSPSSARARTPGGSESSGTGFA